MTIAKNSAKYLLSPESTILTAHCQYIQFYSLPVLHPIQSGFKTIATVGAWPTQYTLCPITAARKNMTEVRCHVGEVKDVRSISQAVMRRLAGYRPTFNSAVIAPSGYVEWDVVCESASLLAGRCQVPFFYQSFLLFYGHSVPVFTMKRSFRHTGVMFLKTRGIKHQESHYAQPYSVCSVHNRGNSSTSRIL